MIKTNTYKVRITFTTELLGSQPTIDIASEFLAKKAGLLELPSDEIETLPEVLEKGTTVFHKDKDGRYLLVDYQLKGFLKEAGNTFNGKINNIKALKSKVERYVFVDPSMRMIRLYLPEGEEVKYLERPLRAETAQGPRIAIARSEMLPAGTNFDVNIELLPCEITENVLRTLLDYGKYKGLGQWRNGGYGRFSYTMNEIVLP